MTEVPVVRDVTDQEWLFCYHFLTSGDHIASLLKAYPNLVGRPRARLYWQAKQILARPAVETELQRLRLELRSTQRITLEQHLHTLAELRDEARAASQFAAASRCEELRGRAAGLYVEHVLVRNEGVSRDEILARVMAIMAQNPRLAEIVQNALGHRISAALPAEGREIGHGEIVLTPSSSRTVGN